MYDKVLECKKEMSNDFRLVRNGKGLFTVRAFLPKLAINWDVLPLRSLLK